MAAASGSSAAAPQRFVVIGGVGGGATAAARLRRLNETAQITLIDKASVSIASCGLPYFVGDLIQEEAKLYVATPTKFEKWFRVDVREGTEATAIDRTARTVALRDLKTGQESSLAYDALILAPGAPAIRPRLPGVDLPGVFCMKTVPDSVKVKKWLEDNKVERAVVVGGGFIGLEMVENLVHRGVKVSLVEAATQVLTPLDAEMIEPIHELLKSKGVELHLGDGLAGIEDKSGGSGTASMEVKTSSGKLLPAGLVLMAVGVRPETGLAKAAGLELGKRGGIKVDEHMRTSDPHIWAVGDAVEVKDWVTGEMVLVPLAGPANRQGRIAADAIVGRKPDTFRGVQGTAVVGMFGWTVAMTGASEKVLQRAGIPYQKAYLHLNNHAGYYPGAQMMGLKLLWAPKDGKVLGVQAVGPGEGVEKRVDVIAMAIQMGGTVYDLEEAELCYAPQYGSAKDPVNFAGMVAANALRGDMPLSQWEQLQEARSDPKAVVVDVRETAEVQRGAVEGAVNIPLPTLATKIPELDKGKKYYVYCQVGLRGYLATRQMVMAGLDAVNISGGYRTLGAVQGAGARQAKM